MARRFLAILLATLMVVSAVPLGALAAGEGGCTHTHDSACGFIPAVAGVDCDRDCQPEAEGGAIVHVEGCAYRAAVEGAPCQHTHDASCGGLECTCTKTADCAAQTHEADCPKSGATVVSCTKAADCAAQTHEADCPKSGATVVSCTKAADCAAQTHDEGCPKYAAPVVSCTKAADCVAQTHETDCPKSVAPVVSCTKAADCAAQTHEADCPKYAAPVVSCTKAADCAAQTHEAGCPKSVAPVVSCTKTADCAAQTHDEGCPKATSAPQPSEAVRSVQASIDALPTGEAYLAMSEDEKEAAYENAAAVSEAYIALSEEERGMVDATMLNALFAVINAGISQMAIEGAGTEDDPYVVAGDVINWGTGETWYEVQESITINERITVTGTVNLKLGEGCTLNASSGIRVSPGNHLVIYGFGTLVATAGEQNAAIGGNTGEGGGNVTINGGTVNVHCTGTVKDGGAAIGGGYKGAAGTTVINGGDVTVTCDSNAAIGGGCESSSETDYIANTTTITGGTVYIEGGGYGGGVANALTIDGGTVTVIGGGGEHGQNNDQQALCSSVDVSTERHWKITASPTKDLTGEAARYINLKNETNIPWTNYLAVKFEPCNHSDVKNGSCKYCGLSITATVESGETVSVYADLADALNAANTAQGSTLTLKKDVENPGTFTVTGKFTLNLNGHKLTNGNQVMFYVGTDSDAGELIVEDTGDGAIHSWNSSISVGKQGTLRIKGGTISNGLDNYGTCYIEGGVLEKEENNFNSFVIWNQADARLEISGGVIQSGTGCIANDDRMWQIGTTVITGGTFYCGGNASVFGGGQEQITVYGGKYPNGLSVPDPYVHEVLADGFACYNAEGNPVPFTQLRTTKLTIPVEVKECVHDYNGYFLPNPDGDGHYAACKYCGQSTGETQPHSAGESGVCVCGLATTSYLKADGSTGQAFAQPMSQFGTKLTNGWYVVDSGVTSSGTLRAEGDVNLILTDKPFPYEQIYVMSGSLTVWGQSAATTATIESIYDHGGCSFILNSGNVNVASDMGRVSLSNITVNGGKLATTPSMHAPSGSITASNKFTINGGEVVAQGISTGSFEMNSGKLASTGSFRCSGVEVLENGTIVVNGGTIIAAVGNSEPGRAFSKTPTLSTEAKWKVTKDDVVVPYAERTADGYTGYTSTGTLKIEPCPHNYAETGHDKSCAWCGDSSQTEHTWDSAGCCTICQVQAQASVAAGDDTQFFDTLANALASELVRQSQSKNTTVRLLEADSDGVCVEWTVGGVFTLDLNGKMLRPENTTDIINNADVTIRNGTIAGYNQPGLKIQNGTGHLLLADCEITHGLTVINGKLSDLLAPGYAFREQKSDGSWAWIYDNSLSQISYTAKVQRIPVSITTQPANVNMIAGTAGKTLSVTAAATETGKEITYQWCDGTGNAINGATSASYTLPTNLAVGSHRYTCKVTCDGYTITSDAATVSVRPAAPTGVTGGRLTITGVDSTMEYSVDGNTYTAVTGTSVTVSAAGTYRVRVAGTADYAPSDAVSVKVYDAKGEYTVTTTSNGSTKTEVTRDDGTSSVTETVTKDGVTTKTTTNRDKNGNVTNTIVTKTDSTGKVLEKITYFPDGSYVKDGYAPKMIEGSGSKFRGKSMMFRSDDEFCNFVKVTVNGSTLSERNYTAESGSIKITLSRSYLNKLRPGTYKLGIVSTNGTAEGTFVIPSHGSGWNPGTGDRILIAVAVLILSGAALGGVAVYVLKKRKK